MATRTASMAYPDLGNGEGLVYVSAGDGTFPTPTQVAIQVMGVPYYGVTNDLTTKGILEQTCAATAAKNAASFAQGYVTMTNAAADNLTSLTINGVNQVSGSVAMTVGDLDASAASIAAAINATVPGSGPDYRAYSVGPAVYIICNIAGGGPNGDVVTANFSGASTADEVNIGGGSDAGDPLIRVWLDAGYSASPSPTSIASEAVDITDLITVRGLNSPRPFYYGLVDTGAVEVRRIGSDIDLFIDGVGASPANEVDDILLDNPSPNDRLWISVDPSGLPFVLKHGTGNISLQGSLDVTISTPSDIIILKWSDDGGGTFKWIEATRSKMIDPAMARANRIVVPATPGVHVMNVPAAGTLTIIPGLTGTPPANTTYKSIVRLQGTIALAGNFNIVFDPSGTPQAGDKGIIYGGISQVTVNPGVSDIVVSDAVLTFQRRIPAPLALTGNWAVEWLYDGANFNATLVPGIDTAGSITTAAIAAGAVTDAKVASGISGSKITDGTITQAKLDSAVQIILNAFNIQQTTIVVTSAQILAGFVTPIDLIAAPGAGFGTLVIDVMERVLWNSAVYATNTTYWIKAQTATVPQFQSTGGLLANTPSNRRVPQYNTFLAASTQVVENEPIQFTVPVGAPTAGDSDVEITLWYRRVSL